MAATAIPAGPVRKVITLARPVAAAEPVVAAPLKMARADDTVPMAVATGLMAATRASRAAMAVFCPVDRPLNQARNWAASWVTAVTTG